MSYNQRDHRAVPEIFPNYSLARSVRNTHRSYGRMPSVSTNHGFLRFSGGAKDCEPALICHHLIYKQYRLSTATSSSSCACTDGGRRGIFVVTIDGVDPRPLTQTRPRSLIILILDLESCGSPDISMLSRALTSLQQLVRITTIAVSSAHSCPDEGSSG